MHSTLTPHITRYVSERRNRGDITRLSARSMTGHLRSFSDSHGNRGLGQLGPRAVDRWLEQCRDLAPSTRAGRLSTLRGFAHWLVTERIIDRGLHVERASHPPPPPGTTGHDRR